MFDPTFALVLILLVAFLWSVQTAIPPYLLAVALVWAIWPSRHERWGRGVLVATGVLTVLWFIRETKAMLAPFAVALVVAYIFHPLVTWLERTLRVRRTVGTLLVISLLFLVPPAFLVGVVPSLVTETQGFATKLPTYALEIQKRAAPLLSRVAPNLKVETIFEEASKRSGSLAQGVLSGAINLGKGIGVFFGFVLYLFITPIITFFLLRDFDRFGAALNNLLPERIRPLARDLMGEINDLWGRYLRGQLAIAVILGLLAVVLFSLFRINYALLLGFLTGILNFIPRLGIVLTIIPAVIIALLSPDPMVSLLKVGLVFGILQVLETTLISPKIAGKSVGLHPVTVMIAVLIGGYFFGFLGLLVAVPLTGLLKVLYTRLVRARGPLGT